MKVGDKVWFGRKAGEKTLGEVLKVNAASVKVKQLESRGTMKDHPVGTEWRVHPTLVTPVSGAVTPAAPPAPKAAPLASGDPVGRTFTFRGTEYRVTGIVKGRPRYPVSAERVSDGKRFKFPADVLGTLGAVSATPSAPPAGVRVGAPVTFEGYVWGAGRGPTLGTVTGVVTAVDGGEVEVFAGKTPLRAHRIPFAKVAPAPKRSESDLLSEFHSVHLHLEPEVLTADGERSRSEVSRIRATLNRALRALEIELGRKVDDSEAFASVHGA